MRHLAPPVVYLDAPLTYLAEGQANKFFTGMSGVNSAQNEDPSVINYFVIEPRYEAERDEQGSPTKVRNQINTGMDHQSDASSDFGDRENFHTHYGTRLVGMIPCSDAFGVDLVIENYMTHVDKQKKAREHHDDSIRRMSSKTKVQSGDDEANSNGHDKDTYNRETSDKAEE